MDGSIHNMFSKLSLVYDISAVEQMEMRKHSVYMKGVPFSIQVRCWLWKFSGCGA